jgi:hypothetical protein
MDALATHFLELMDIEPRLSSLATRFRKDEIHHDLGSAFGLYSEIASE